MRPRPAIPHRPRHLLAAEAVGAGVSGGKVWPRVSADIRPGSGRTAHPLTYGPVPARSPRRST